MTLAEEPALADHTPHRFSVEEYERMCEIGLIPPDARVELIEGEVVDVPPIGIDHGWIVDQIAEVLGAGLRGRARVRTQGVLLLGGTSMPQPDVCVLVGPGDRYRRRHPTEDDVIVAIEVSHSTVRYDRGIKLPLYARSGIRESWIVDVAAHAMRVFTDPDDEDYETETVVGVDGVVTVLDVDFPVVDLIGQATTS
jgi:Uma2 family endonuclease